MGYSFMYGRLRILAPLLFLCLTISSSGVTIVGSVSADGAKGRLLLKHVPSMEQLAALQIELRFNDAGILTQYTVKPADNGQWSQVRPEIAQNSNALHISVLAPNITFNPSTDTSGITSVDFQFSGVKAGTNFASIIDTIVVKSALNPQGESIPVTLALTNTDYVKVRKSQNGIAVNHRIWFRRQVLGFFLSKSENVTLRVVDLKGTTIQSFGRKQLAPGFHELAWDGHDQHGRIVPSGTYLLQLFLGNYTYNKKVGHTR